jgi:predicted ABC-type sugar transport system permease subunit
VGTSFPAATARPTARRAGPVGLLVVVALLLVLLFFFLLLEKGFGVAVIGVGRGISASCGPRAD